MTVAMISSVLIVVAFGLSADYTDYERAVSTTSRERVGAKLRIDRHTASHPPATARWY